MQLEVKLLMYIFKVYINMYVKRKKLLTKEEKQKG